MPHHYVNLADHVRKRRLVRTFIEHSGGHLDQSNAIAELHQQLQRHPYVSVRRLASGERSPYGRVDRYWGHHALQVTQAKAIATSTRWGAPRARLSWTGSLVVGVLGVGFYFSLLLQDVLTLRRLQMPAKMHNAETADVLESNPPKIAELNFEAALAHVLIGEHGCQDDPDDWGNVGANWTCDGITQAVYNRYFYGHVRNMTEEEMHHIYFEDYWLASGAYKLQTPLNLVIFDVAVNAGVGRANEFLAKAHGLTPQAQALHILDQREQFYRRLAQHPTQKKFKQGWLNRNQRIRAVAEELSNPL
ncbi:MAG: hypothetical protein F6K19_10235 [Cyanothece sp. SIO1E1]|nr:hypothetical protein [Cyanothece sp. SIO1E1]